MTEPVKTNASVIEDGDASDRKKLKLDNYREGILLGYGNPLLDIQVNGTEEFLKKYDLKADNAILAEEKHKPMYKDMVEIFKDVEYIPGGATQNAIKVAQWIIGVPKATTFFGCISKDKFGNILEKKAREAGVNVKYQYTDKEATGTCGVVVTADKRSLCANLGAANCFTEDHLDDQENWNLVEKAKFFYIAGYPLTVCPPAILRIAKHACENKKVFCMNLSAPFLCQFYKEPMLKVLPFVDILFGNESEADAFAKENNLNIYFSDTVAFRLMKFEGCIYLEDYYSPWAKTTDRKEIAQKITEWKKENKSLKRIVVITQGEDPTIVASDGKVEEYPVIPIDKKNIVDCNGAGDAFVGGFLAQLVAGKSIAECIRCGHYAANVIIQRSGCTFPAKSSFVPNE